MKIKFGLLALFSALSLFFANTNAESQTGKNPVIHIAGAHGGGNDAKAGYWRNGSLTDMSAGEYTSGALAITIANNSVYMAGSYQEKAYDRNDPGNPAAIPRACFWKDNVRTDLQFGFRGSEAQAITVVGNTVYTAGYSIEERPPRSNREVITACYWKDGTKVLLDDWAGATVVRGIAVLGNTVIAAGYYQGNNVDVACFWTDTGNGRPVKTPLSNGESMVEGIAVSGNQVYITGYAGHIGMPCYWTVSANGTLQGRTDLQLGSNSLAAYTKSIAVSGNKVYTAGYYVAPGEKFIACFWEGTTRKELSLPSADVYSRAEKIVIDGNNIYIYGFYSVPDISSRNRKTVSCLWINGNRVNHIGAADVVFGDAEPIRGRVTAAPPIWQNLPINQNAVWPTTATWTARGLPTGLQQPAGTTVNEVVTFKNLYTVTLSGVNKAAFNNLVAQMEGKRGWIMYDRNSSAAQEDASFGTSVAENIYIEYDIKKSVITIRLNNEAK